MSSKCVNPRKNHQALKLWVEPRRNTSREMDVSQSPTGALEELNKKGGYQKGKKEKKRKKIQEGRN